MTRTLLLIRHAEAARTPAGGTDRDRPLTDHGVRQAELIGRLVASGVLPAPELALCSDALRARTTWKTAEAAAGLTAVTVIDSSLYSTSYEDVILLLRTVPDDVQVVAVIGHAPEIPGLAYSFADRRPPEASSIGWPAAGVGVADYDGPWAQFPDAARLVHTRHVDAPDPGN